MLDLYHNALVFTPAAFYGLVGTILFIFNAFTFNKGVALFAVAYAGHVYVSIIYGGWIGPVVQTVIAAIVFVLMVMVFSGKISGETILTMSGLLALTPLPSGILAFVAVFLLLGAYSAVELGRSGVFKDTLRDAVVSTGMGQMAPNYGHLENRKEASVDAKKISLLPFVALVYTGFGLFFMLSTFFTADF